MIKVTLTNEILRYITEIDQNRYKVSSVKLSKTVMNRLRKNSKKKSSYASNKIEGNPLSQKQVDEVIDSDERKALSEAGTGSSKLFSGVKLSRGKCK